MALSGATAAEPAYLPQTATDPKVPLDQLSLMVKPLTKDELAIEAKEWLALVRAKVKEISDLEISVKRKNDQIESAQRLSKAAEEASDALKEAEQKARSGEADPESLRELRERAQEASQEAKQAADEVKAAERRTAGDDVEDATKAALRRAEAEGEGPRVPADDAAASSLKTGATGSRTLESTARKAEQAAEAKAAVKAVILDDLTTLREQRTALIDHANVVLDELAEKGGTVDLERKYLKAVSGFQVEVSDSSAAWTAITGWLVSSEGGLRYLWNFVKCVATILGFWLLARVAGTLVRRTVKTAEGMSDLMRGILVKAVRSLILILGIVLGISALEINVSPLLAAIGGLALVVAFALQGTLSNFASGILILAYRPFDVGDEVNTAGVSGRIRSMNMLSTQLITSDNRLMSVPNNQIWGNVITNSTGAETRRVDISIDIPPGMDAVKVRAAVEEVVRNHDLVLADPEPVVKLHEINHVATKLICRPWTKTEDYWKVYWDITHAASEILIQYASQPPQPPSSHVPLPGKHGSMAAGTTPSV